MKGAGKFWTILFVGNGQDGATVGGPAGRGFAGANRVNINKINRIGRLHWGCKKFSLPSTHGRIYCTKPLRVGGSGAKVAFFVQSQVFPIFNDLRPLNGPGPEAERFHLVAAIN